MLERTTPQGHTGIDRAGFGEAADSAGADLRT